MIDLIVYCPNTTKLVTGLLKDFPNMIDVEDENNPRLIVDKTPTVRNGDETLALVRCRDENDHVWTVLHALASEGLVKVLGTWEEVQANKKAKTLYNRVYPRAPFTWADEDGREHTHKPSEEIGRFA